MQQARVAPGSGRRPLASARAPVRRVALISLLVGWASSGAAAPGAQDAAALWRALGLDRVAGESEEAAGDQVQQDDKLRIRSDSAGRLDVHVRDLEIPLVLEALSYETRTNIVATRSVNGTVSANLYNVSLPEALQLLLTPNGFAYRQTGRTYFVGTVQEIDAQKPPPRSRVFRLKYINQYEAVAAVKAVLGSEARVAATGAPSSGATGAPGAPGGAPGGGAAGAGQMNEYTSGDYIIVTDTEDRLEQVAALLKEIDVRPQQVLIEATVLRATLNENNQFGIDFTLLGGVDFQNVSSTSHAAADLTTGDLPARELQDTNFNLHTDFRRNVAAGGFTFGIIKNNVAAFVRALEEVTDVVVVANPKVVALNKNQAGVIVGRRDGYLTTTVTETAAVQTVEFLETGTQIRFRPTINDDGTVRLWVHPKDSNGGLTAANLPFEETTEAEASLLVRDGHTVLIGGLFRERTLGSRSQLPVVGNIPVAGLLFQSRSDQTVREEVIILLTVHVIKDAPAEQERHTALLEDIELARVGSRRGLLGVGREQLAQAFYQEALRQAELGDWDRALLNVRMALHNYPKHSAALKLLEQLQGQRLWSNEGSRMRTFALELIEAERPGDERPPPLGRPQMDWELGQPAPTTQAAQPGDTP